jgi:hypothetical protein
MLGTALLVGTLGLAGCGGGSGGGTSAFGNGSGGGSGGGTGGGTDPNAVTAADLSVVLTTSSGVRTESLSNSGQEKITATVTAVDANRNALANIPVTVAVDADAVATVSATKTDTSGTVVATVGTGSNRSNRVVTVTVTSGTLVRVVTFQVIGAKLTARTNPSVIAPGATGEVEFVLLDSASNPMVGQRVVVSGIDGVETVGTTGLNGNFKYGYTAPSVTATRSIRASAGGIEVVANVLVQADSTSIPSAVGIVRSASVAANPSVVPVNLTGSSNRAELRALFLTSANAPVQNVRVRFDLAGDAQSIGGTISSASNVVYTDANGVAATSYIPGARFSPTDGVTVRACWSNVDFAAGTCPNAVSTTLTVISDALSVSIGTDNKILLGDSSLDFVKRYIVQVNDSAGVAKGDVQISPSVDLLRFFKGYWQVAGPRWDQVVTASCDNEDLNRNGVSEVYSNGAIEDRNASFNLLPGRPALEPRKGDVVVSFEGSSRTNEKGQVVLRLTYPQNVGSWVSFNLVVAASGVAGTEGRANFNDTLPVLAALVTDITVEPPFRKSPYGVLTSPTVSVTSPEGKSGMLCTDPN